MVTNLRQMLFSQVAEIEVQSGPICWQVRRMILFKFIGAEKLLGILDKTLFKKRKIQKTNKQWNFHPTTNIIGAMLPSRTCGYVWLRTQVASLNWDTELSKQQGERDQGDYQPKLLILGDLIVQCCQCLYFSHNRKIKQSTTLTRTWGRNSEWVK